MKSHPFFFRIHPRALQLGVLAMGAAALAACSPLGIVNSLVPGAVVVIPDYRLSPQVAYPAFVEDSALAVKWGLDHAAQLGADPRQVYIMGPQLGRLQRGHGRARRALAERGGRESEAAGRLDRSGRAL
ncbi:alpha/beta hydrolase [Variovorax sp. SRS16]|uniref:alpha/beta hydrolase n=1 Tax=Variovorax sp. SRS16 TaxID=282217 RepID=UPI001E3C357F|nr:alpha/beta hydrolase fold domain-containing protein [Variovorax sp. SRS16]